MRLSKTVRLILIFFPLILMVQCDSENPDEETVVLSASENVKIEAYLDREEIHLGEDARLTISAVHRSGTEMEMPESIGVPKGMEVVGSGKSGPKQLRGTAVKETAWFDISTTVPGRYSIPPVTIKYSDDHGTYEYMTSTQRLDVVRTVNDISAVADIKDIKPPEKVERSYTTLFVLAGSVVAGAAFVYLVYRVVKRRRLRRAASKEVVPPKIRALLELKEVEESDLLGESRYEDFVVRVSSVVRTFLRDQFSVPASEMTSEEVVSRADKGYYLSEESQKTVRELLARCDDVKFAAHSPAERDCRDIYESAIGFIEKSC